MDFVGCLDSISFEENKKFLIRIAEETQRAVEGRMDEKNGFD